MGYSEWKNALWTVHSSTSRGHFLSGRSQAPGPAKLLIDFSLLSSLLSAVNLSQARMQRLFRGEKYLSALYADGTFREVFVPEQDMRRIIYSLIKFRGRPSYDFVLSWDKLLAQISRNHRFVMVSGYKSCSLNLYAANSSHFVPFIPWLQ